MEFRESVDAVKSQGATLKGRACRSEYWWYQLSILLFGLLLSFIGGILVTVGLITAGSVMGTILLCLAGLLGIYAFIYYFIYLYLILGICVAVRRFHDVGINGWVYLLLVLFGNCLGGLGNLAILIICVIEGTRGRNQFGEDPLGNQNTTDFTTVGQNNADTILQPENK